MWGKIIIPMYRLWLHSLYGLYGPRCPLSSKRPINLISLSPYNSAVDEPKFMGRLSDHPWWKTGSPKSFLGSRLPELLWHTFKRCLGFFLVINKKFACSPFNHIPTYRELGRPIGRLRGSCLIARPRNGSHMATGWLLIHSTAYNPVQIHYTMSFEH